MLNRFLLTALCVILLIPMTHSQTLQQALNSLGYTINAETDYFDARVFFQKTSGVAAIVFQESSQLYDEAFGLYVAQADQHYWIIGGDYTGLPKVDFLPDIESEFNLAFHPNYTGNGFINSGPVYSDPTLNPSGSPRAFIYQTRIDNQIIPFSYIICWEDLGSTGDFQDMIVRIDGVEAVTDQGEPYPINNMIRLTQWQESDGGNGHWYGILPVLLPWNSAIIQSANLFIGDQSGYPATITSQAENDFILNNVISGVENPGVLGQFYMGGYWSNDIWYWRTGEEFDYTNWDSGEPNNIGTETIVTAWGSFSPDRPEGYWNNVMPTIALWSIVEWDKPSSPPPYFAGQIQGNVSDDNNNMLGVEINLYDNLGQNVATTYTNESGHYEFADIPNGEYLVEMIVPMGYSPLNGPSIPVTLYGGTAIIDYQLGDATTGKLRSFWWWRDQFAILYAGEETFCGMTIRDVTEYGEIIYDHFYDREDGYGIQIEGLTYRWYPDLPVSFSYLKSLFVEDNSDDIPTKMKKHILTIMLNVASGRLSQNAVISSDGATVSQAITYYCDILESGNYTWRDWYYPMTIEMGRIVPAGIIPLETPDIMYKIDNRDSGDFLPSGFALHQNYPNPFNPSTVISFELPVAGDIGLSVYNISGQKVSTLTEGYFEAGKHEIIWDASQVASGVYFYRLKTESGVETRKMTLIK